MNLLQDILVYVRRIIKAPSNASITDNLLIDYVNRFWLMDMDARMQLFDLKTKYQFQTVPGVDQYNMPLYNTNRYPVQTEPGGQLISYYPVYQGFTGEATANGVKMPFYTNRGSFFNIWPNYTQSLLYLGQGDGITTAFTLQIPFLPPFPPTPAVIYSHTPFILRGHVDISGIIAANSNIDPIVGTALNPNVPQTSMFPAIYVTATDIDNGPLVVSDSGQFLASNQNQGLLTGDITPAWNSTLNVVDYVRGTIYVEFDVPPQAKTPIRAQCYYIQPGIPRAVLFYNNVLTIRPPPNIPYLVELDAYLTPAAFLSTSQSVPFAYMSEYIARGAARKILSDTGDIEQFQFYEPLFREQEMLVWKRSQRQFTATRTPTIFSEFSSQSPSNNFSGGGN
jgi:hypothetical protein